MKRLPTIFAVLIVLIAFLASLPIHLRQELGWMDGISGSRKTQTVWRFGIESIPVVTDSPLAIQFRALGLQWQPNWHNYQGTYVNTFGRHVGHAHGGAPEIHDFNFDLQARYITAATHDEIRALFRVMSNGTEAEKQAAVQAAIDRVLGPPATTLADDIQQIAASYPQLKSMTPEPVYVDPGLAMLCRGIEPADVEAAKEVSGPHALTRVRIYMNESAADVFERSTARYPVGSIIVKEKQAWGSKDAARDGVGGMIKRSAGYDSEHGDWEYFYFESPRKIERGRIASCVQCHSGARGKDYVFGHWSKSATSQQ